MSTALSAGLNNPGSQEASIAYGTGRRACTLVHPCPFRPNGSTPKYLVMTMEGGRLQQQQQESNRQLIAISLQAQRGGARSRTESARCMCQKTARSRPWSLTGSRRPSCTDTSSTCSHAHTHTFSRTYPWVTWPLAYAYRICRHHAIAAASRRDEGWMYSDAVYPWERPTWWWCKLQLPWPVYRLGAG